MNQRFLQALIRVFVLHIFTDKADRNLVIGIAQHIQHPVPAGEIARSRHRLQLQSAAHEIQNQVLQLRRETVHGWTRMKNLLCFQDEVFSPVTVRR